jgi:hypothetical protein
MRQNTSSRGDLGVPESIGLSPREAVEQGRRAAVGALASRLTDAWARRYAVAACAAGPKFGGKFGGKFRGLASLYKRASGPPLG